MAESSQPEKIKLRVGVPPENQQIPGWVYMELDIFFPTKPNVCVQIIKK